MDDRENRMDRENLFKKHKENIYFRWGLTAFVVIAACIIVMQFVTKLPAVVGAVKTILRALAPVFYGLCISYLLDPIVERIQKLVEGPLGKTIKNQKTAAKVSRGIGIIVSLLVAVVVVWTLIAMVLPQLIESIYTIVGNLPGYYNTVSLWVTKLIDDNLEMANLTDDIMKQTYQYLSSFLTDRALPWLQTLLTNVTTSAVGLAKAALNLVIGLIISVYLLMGKRKFLAQSKKACYALLGRKANELCNVCSYANLVFGGFIGGKILDSAIIGVICFVGCSLLKLEYSMLIALIVGVTNIIPFFGPYLGAIPSAFLLLLIDPIQCLTFVVFVLILQQIDGNIIGPLILGDATGLSSFWVIVAILGFGAIWGVPGMIIGVPLFAVIYKICTEGINKLLRDRGLSTVTDDYKVWNYPPREDSAKWRPTTRRQKKKALRMEQRMERMLHLHGRHRGEEQTGEAEKNPDKEA